jgi:two-component system alkaline phosphatase synthesis response regulator PhoP
MNAIVDRAEPRTTKRELGKGIETTLRTIETNLLRVLSNNIGKPMSREELCRQVWNCEFRGTTRTIDQTIATLRKKLQPSQRIVTVHRIGYAYEETVN